MAQLSDLTVPAPVLQAIHEFDALGRDAFLKKFGFHRARNYFLVHEDKAYDSKAVLGAAFKYLKGAPLPASSFSGGDSNAAAALQRLGFRVDKVTDWVAQVTEDHIDAEVRQFRTLGRQAYLARYGGKEASKFFLMVNQDRFDAKAVLVSAVRRATGISNISHHEIESTEAGVAEPLRKLGYRVISDWPITRGQTLPRKTVHDLLGGNRQRGISVLKSGQDILIFSGAKQGQRFGYDRYEGFQEDGSFGYTGEGTVGDQSLESSGNRSILNADSNGARLHLFTTEGPLATYVGEVVTGDPPYVWRRSLDVNQEAERNVIVFRLIPVGRVELQKIAPTQFEKPSTWIPPSDSEYAQVARAVDGRVVSRKEMRLQADFGLWLQSIGHSVQRYPILLPDSPTYVHPDLFDATSLVVFEAKKSAARPFMREAIGQVLDYHNLLVRAG